MREQVAVRPANQLAPSPGFLDHAAEVALRDILENIHQIVEEAFDHDRWKLTPANQTFYPLVELVTDARWHRHAEDVAMGDWDEPTGIEEGDGLDFFFGNSQRAPFAVGGGAVVQFIAGRVYFDCAGIDEKAIDPCRCGRPTHVADVDQMTGKAALRAHRKAVVPGVDLHSVA